MDLGDDSDNFSYGRLLGEYFHVVSTIGALETEFDAAELEDNETYRRLLDSRREIKAELDVASRDLVDSDIKAVLDEAFSDR